MANLITVACKMPHGVICRLHEMVDVEEPLPGGGTKTVKRARPTGSVFKLNGYLKPAVGDEPAPPAAPGAFALTHGVDEDLFNAWMAQNHDLDMIRNGLIFASAKADYVKSKANEREKDVRCGLEPINRSKLPRGIQDGKAA